MIDPWIFSDTEMAYREGWHRVRDRQTGKYAMIDKSLWNYGMRDLEYCINVFMGQPRHVNQGKRIEELEAMNQRLRERDMQNSHDLLAAEFRESNYRHALLRALGDHRVCPKCSHAFTPDDLTQRDIVSALHQ